MAQKKVCDDLKVPLHAVNLNKDQVPSRLTLIQLMDLIDASPRPILVEGHRGIDHSGFASAVALLLQGQSPQSALDQFTLKYGQVGGPEHAPLGRAILDYRVWLASRHLAHSPDRFRSWARSEYMVHSIPAPPPPIREGALARQQREARLSR